MTPLPYKNRKDFKGGTNDKTHDSHTHETIFLGAIMIVVQETRIKGKNEEDKEYIEPPSIKNDKIDSQSHEVIR